MKTIIRLVVVFILLIVAVPAYSAEAVQIFNCQQDEEATQAALEAAAGKWLKAAKTMKSGGNLQVFLRFPVAATMGEDDFTFVLVAPSLTEWGTFMDDYPGSVAQKVDVEFNELCDCPNSSLWETVEIK